MKHPKKIVQSCAFKSRRWQLKTQSHFCQSITFGVQPIEELQNMTKEELEKRKLDARNTLAVLTALEEIIVERVGRDGFQEKVDSAFDELTFVEKQLKKLNRKA